MRGGRRKGAGAQGGEGAYRSLIVSTVFSGCLSARGRELPAERSGGNSSKGLFGGGFGAIFIGRPFVVCMHAGAAYCSAWGGKLPAERSGGNRRKGEIMVCGVHARSSAYVWRMGGGTLNNHLQQVDQGCLLVPDVFAGSTFVSCVTTSSRSSCLMSQQRRS